jgi:hypothetical protein
MDNRLPVLLLCIAALVLAAVSLLRLAQGMAAQSMGLFIVTAAVLLAAVVYYLIYRSKNTRE